VSDIEFTTEDMAHMRREGTMRDFIRLVSGPSAGPVRQAATVSESMPADHMPGAWPAGTGSGSPGNRVCPCEACARYAEGRPEPDIAPESA
jgi:hypothetical protein